METGNESATACVFMCSLRLRLKQHNLQNAVFFGESLGKNNTVNRFTNGSVQELYHYLKLKPTLNKESLGSFSRDNK